MHLTIVVPPLSFLQVQEEGVARPVLSLMREATELAMQERSVVWQQLHVVEDQLRGTREENQADAQKHSEEKEALQQRLIESEATVARLKVRQRKNEERVKEVFDGEDETVMRSMHAGRRGSE